MSKVTNVIVDLFGPRLPELGEVRKAFEVGRKGRQPLIWLACIHCGKERWVAIRKGEPKSLLCRSCESRRKWTDPIYRQRQIEQRVGERSSAWKGGRRNRGGYVIVYQPQHPRAHKDGYVYEHILVWEQAHGRSLPADWVVHHINGRKDDNRPENLFAMPKRSHHGKLLLRETRKRLRKIEEENKKLRAQISFVIPVNARGAGEAEISLRDTAGEDGW